MGISIKNDQVEQLARKLAQKHGVGLTEIIQTALEEMQDRENSRPSLAELIKPIQDRIASYGDTGLKADKAFYDEINGENERAGT